MIPLRDDLKSSTRPFVTYAILGINIIVYIYELSIGRNLDGFIMHFGAVPYNIFHPGNIVSYTTIFSSMFIHANLVHLAGNMLFLWTFSDNVEDKIGHIKYFFYYLICGIAGALLHSLTSPDSTVPMVGASGAISGVLGGYILMFPKARILALVPLGFFMRVMYLPSYVFLGLWALYQFLLGFISIGSRGGGVAYFAHIGGFVTGLVIALPFKFKRTGSDAEYQIH